MAQQPKKTLTRGDQTAPASQVIDVDAGDDDVTYDPPLRALIFPLGGVAKIDTVGSTAFTTPAMPAGFQLPAYVTKVYATGTTTTGLIGLR